MAFTKIEVENLGGTTLPVLGAGSLTGIVSSQMPSGNIVQVATAFNGDYLDCNTTSYVDVGLSLSFTPKRSSSTIIVQGIMFHRAHATSTVHGDVRFKILVDSTAVVEEGECYSPLGERWVVFQPMTGTYSNSNTNAKTIKMQVKNVSTTSPCVVNPYTGQSSLLVMEIV